jgi:hypothetical protein
MLCPFLAARVLALAGALSTLAGCGGSPVGAHRFNQPGERLILADEIAKTGAVNAWEAIQRTPTFLSTAQNNRGEPARVWRRGRGSVVLKETPAVIIDGVTAGDIGVLTSIQATRIAWIRILTASAATSRYGTSAGAGAIVVQTKGADQEVSRH